MKYLALPAPQQFPIPIRLTPEQIRKVCSGAERKSAFDIIPQIEGRNRVVTETYWQKYGSKSYSRNTNKAFINSYVVFSDNLLTIKQTLFPDKVVRAPKGMRFERDSNGIKLIRLSDSMDYHPSVSEMRVPNFATLVRCKMARNFKMRQAARKAEKIQKRNKKENERIERIFQKNLGNTMVTLEDSRRAGNCLVGSLAFAERKLKVTREEVLAAAHLFAVPAPKLISVANGDKVLVMNAVKQAWRRETVISI